MALRFGRDAPLALAFAVLVAVIAGCSAAGPGGPSTSPAPTGAESSGGPSPSSSANGGALNDAGAKEALLARFGPLVYCDPDFYPVVRQDEAAASVEHLAEMQADTAAWAVIAGHLGFDPATPPKGDGLLAAYREWKMLRALMLTPTSDGWSFDARFGGPAPDSSAAPPVTHVLGSIATDGTITITSQEPSGPPPCPICLARGTVIATPGGGVAVEDIRPGDPVWTLDRSGHRIPAVVDRIGSMPVPAGHEVVHLVLADGRGVLVSPGHPLPDGRPVGNLKAGDPYDGSVVASAERVAYDGGRTFDLLPSGGTGIYWANGIELGSTLFR
jgi:hypothetical protein